MAGNIPVILIIGPTAGGKTRLAIELATRLSRGGECVCADSMQVYRGMEIGTASPTVKEQGGIPHHLFSFANPAGDDFSVDKWLALAEGRIAEIRERGKHPILVGGTNLYIKAFMEGLFQGPDPDPDLRKELEDTAPHLLREELERIDPEAAARIHPNDRRRTVRAIEVYRLTGRPISAHQREWNRGTVRDDVLIVGLAYPASLINRRINARVKEMIDDGLVEEARRLWETNSQGRQAREALGYKQLIAHFEGTCDLETAIEEIKIHTRRYAKQQRTWLRRFRHYPNSIWVNLEEAEAEIPVDEILDWIERKTNPSRA